MNMEYPSPRPSAGRFPDTVLGKVTALLSAFGIDDRSVGLKDLVARTGLAKTTAHRLLADLVEVHLLERDADGNYRLGGRLFELGMRASVERSLLEVATPFLQDLYVRTQETVHLGVREGFEVVYVSKIGGHRQAKAPSRVGGRMPLHCTAIGKVLLAHADDAFVREVLATRLERRTAHTITAVGRIRRQLELALQEGVAYEREESTMGLVCVAAPVLDGEDRPIAAISIAGAATRFRPERHVGAVRAAAAGIGATLARRAELLDPNR